MTVPSCFQVSTASFAYPTHDTARRVALAEKLRTVTIPDGCFVLTTCLRAEFVTEDSPDMLDGFLSDLIGVDHNAIIRTGNDAMRHVFRVAAGLDSPVIGEREILTQFRTQLGSIAESGLISGLLVKLLESAVSVGRQARHHMPGKAHDSLAAIACELVSAHEQVGVFGAGAMASSVVERLLSLPTPPRVSMFVRSPERSRFDGVEIHPITEACQALVEFPAIISATSAKGRLVDDEKLGELLLARSEPLMLIDMAMPPDFQPPAGSAANYVGIDALAAQAPRRPGVEEAEKFVEKMADEMTDRLRQHGTVAPVIAGLMNSGDDVVDQIVQRFARRLGQGDDEAVLRQTAHTVARTLLASPVGYLRNTSDPARAADVLAQAFGIDDV